MLNNPNGIHYLCELFGSDVSKINDLDFLKNTFFEALKETSLIVLHDYFYKFTPHGVTGFFLLSTSHISIHTWPEHNYVAFDIFSCGKKEDTLHVVERVSALIGYENRTSNFIERGYKV